MRLRLQLHPAQHLPHAAAPSGTFFTPPKIVRELRPPTAWMSTSRLFGWYAIPTADEPPDWHHNPFTNRRSSRVEEPWWAVPDFDPTLGDIKGVWELSRFDWVLAYAQQAQAGNQAVLTRLNSWLSNWSASNPPYRGHNWKCGQEASIRVLHLAVASLLLGQTENPSPALIELIRLHLRRVAATTAYAEAQRNNHSISEAAALYVGGNWLRAMGDPRAEAWASHGRRALHANMTRLVERDGSFSQYSTNYHRLMLDTLSVVEIWRRNFDLTAFPDDMRERCAAATRWLVSMVDPISGEAPNLGANDGANLLPLTDADWRDFRPSAALGAALFLERRAYDREGPWRDHLAWLGVREPSTVLEPLSSTVFDDGGYMVLRHVDAHAILRYPRFRFRPSHADALHVDLWVAGENVLRDGGTYTYAGAVDLQNEFAGVRGHNTAQFDGHDQMPRLGRFLWGRWVRTDALYPLKASSAGIQGGAAFHDYMGARQSRSVLLTESSLTVEDDLGGRAHTAVLRWRLSPRSWRLSGSKLSDGHHTIQVHETPNVRSIRLVSGWESRYYMRKTPLPVLEIEVAVPAAVRTEYRWDS